MEAPPFSNDQLAALRYAEAILSSAGLSPQALSHLSPGSTHSSTHSTPTAEHSVPPSAPNTSTPSPAILASRYEPPMARMFTDDKVNRGLNKVNHETRVDAIVEHPLGAIVEYPQTGEVTGARIAHIFNVDANPTRFTHPKSNFQYSLGDGHGGREDVVKA
ncbi:hypothetical protein PAXINDRAFT_11219 [Paxillus involutus ATCC 200175]|nr:hypothetical protein PAXINDRAFT_11219 [Paxillus involutus ATCC 200175]